MASPKSLLLARLPEAGAPVRRWLRSSEHIRSWRVRYFAAIVLTERASRGASTRDQFLGFVILSFLPSSLPPVMVLLL